jgi:LysR family glycine cleavage system transcriptional activator
VSVKRTAIDRRRLPLNALRAFEAVGSQLSFTLGAQSLSVTQSVISRHISHLEDLLGRKLIERRPGGIALTEAGARLLPALEKSFGTLESVVNDLIDAEEGLQRRLKIQMPPTFLQQVGLPMIHGFREAFPQIAIDIVTSETDESGPFSAAVVYDQPRASDQIRDTLWMVQNKAVCSPELASRCAGMSLAEFLRSNTLLHARNRGERRDSIWRAFVRQAGIACPTDRGLTFDTGSLAVRSAMAGHGVALADIVLFAEELADGRLVAPYEQLQQEGHGYFLTFEPDSLAEDDVVAFRSWIIAEFSRRG